MRLLQAMSRVDLVQDGNIGYQVLTNLAKGLVQLRGKTEEDMIENVNIMVDATENMRQHGRKALQKVQFPDLEQEGFEIQGAVR